MARVYDAIRDERQRQDKQWGSAHDDRHTSREWASIRGRYENIQQRLDLDPVAQREALVKMAAVVVAQIECVDRKINDLKAVTP